jgi:hypothetical protein
LRRSVWPDTEGEDRRQNYRENGCRFRGFSILSFHGFVVSSYWVLDSDFAEEADLRLAAPRFIASLAPIRSGFSQMFSQWEKAPNSGIPCNQGMVEAELGGNAAWLGWLFDNVEQASRLFLPAGRRFHLAYPCAIRVNGEAMP